MGDQVVTIAAMEAALAELRELEWRAPGSNRILPQSPWAKDGPWHLAQREVGDIAGHYSETLITTEAGKELRVRKLDTAAPRTPLRAAEVTRLELLRGWLELVSVEDRAIIWAASFHLWRAEPFDWAAMQRRIGYPRTARRLAQRYREAVARLVCRVNGVPVRHFRALLARDGALWASRSTVRRGGNLGFL